MDKDKEVYDWDFMTKISNQEMDTKKKNIFFETMKNDLVLKNSYEEFLSTNQIIDHVMVKNNIDINKAWETQQGKIKAYQKNRNKQYLFTGIAASLLMVCFSYLYFFNHSIDRYSYSTGNFEEKTVTLPDGSRVFLNESTSLVIEKGFNKQVREVKISGEAFFEVSHNKQKPFIVSIDNGHKITVLGTSFNVKNEEKDKIAVYLESGKISYQTPTKEYIMTPKQLAKSTRDTTVLISSSSNHHLYWKTHQMVFSNTPVPEALAKISRAYKVPIVIKSDLSKFKVTAEYDNLPIKSIIETIAILFDLDIKTENDKFIIEAKNSDKAAS